MKPITLVCTLGDCPNSVTLHRDSPLPKDWICPQCLDHLAELEADELYRRETIRLNSTQHEQEQN